MGALQSPRRVALVVTVVIVATAPPAAAATTCTHDAPTVEIAVDATATLAVGAGGAIEVDAVPCETATTSNTDTISVTGVASAADAVVLDLSGGPFAPGATEEPTGESEIEIELSLGDDPADHLSVLGSSGDDILVAGEPGVNLNGDDDMDVLLSEPVGMTLEGGAGNDVLGGDGGGIAPPAGYPVELLGGPGDDALTGGEGHDVLMGGPDQDLLRGGGGDDSLHGGSGTDAATFDRAPGSVKVDLFEGHAFGWGADTLAAVEDIVGTPGRDILLGDGEANRIDGGSGRDRITGGPGDDVIVGGPARDFIKPGLGDDVVFCGRGVDTFTLRSATAPVRINLQKGWAVGEGTDRLRACEKAVGGPLADVIRGTRENNHRLVGGPGNDRIFGRDGNDRLRGGPGHDLLVGGPGDDDLKGGGGADELRGGGGSDRLSGGPGKDICQRDREDQLSRCEA